MAKLASEQPVGPFSEEGPVQGGKKRHWLGTRHSISQVGDHRLALVILCVVMKPDKRSPACSQPAVVLKMQTTASGHGIRNRQRKEAGLRPTARPHCSSGNLLRESWAFTLVLKDTEKKNKQTNSNKQTNKTPMFQGPVVLILKLLGSRYETCGGWIPTSPSSPLPFLMQNKPI